jgi:glutamate decarboxylase
LIIENLSKNLADADEYPAMMQIHQRCISMLSHLWRIPKGETAIGTATTGSSEAIHLGGMAMKRRWIEKRQKEGMSLEGQVNCRQEYFQTKHLDGCQCTSSTRVRNADDVSNERKFARYFDVEARIIPVSKESNYCLDVNKIRENLDENTIGTNL